MLIGVNGHKIHLDGTSRGYHFAETRSDIHWNFMTYANGKILLDYKVVPLYFLLLSLLLQYIMAIGSMSMELIYSDDKILFY